MNQLALRGGHLPPVASVIDKGNAYVLRCKHHNDRLDRKMIDGLARDEPSDSLKRMHEKPPDNSSLGPRLLGGEGVRQPTDS